ncbi:MAG: hypothetical protein H0T76_13400 [Nannocystis sp.]|nr:hypothetical protein [Nannocystis sp.]MBA3547477.1 hypothetical protein [Nannocystis sp.]
MRLISAAALALVSLASAEVQARRATRAELEAAGLTDPRTRTPPPRHRLRLSLLADYVKASAAEGRDDKITRFQYAPLMIDVAYQVQVFTHGMIRPSLAVGGNVANSRNAMPGAIQPGLFAGYQGSLLGIAAGYSYLAPFPAVANADNGHGGVAQPVLYNNHLVQLELSLTTRVDRGALNFAIRGGGMRSHLLHLNIDDDKRWAGCLTLSAGWFFELGARRRRNRAAPPPQTR